MAHGIQLHIALSVVFVALGEVALALIGQPQLVQTRKARVWHSQRASMSKDFHMENRLQRGQTAQQLWAGAACNFRRTESPVIGDPMQHSKINTKIS